MERPLVSKLNLCRKLPPPRIMVDKSFLIFIHLSAVITDRSNAPAQPAIFRVPCWGDYFFYYEVLVHSVLVHNIA
jgi:hypothetical protein